jgi:hypothetical protein
MGNWRNRPTFIDFWPTGIDYTMFIDENGDPELKLIARKITNLENATNDEKFFTVTGCIIKRDDYQKICNDMVSLKKKYWPPEGKYLYTSKSTQKMKRVCFHSKAIRGRNKPFSEKTIDYQAFILELSNLISEISMIILSSTVDKYEHFLKYTNPIHPYNLNLNFILERFVKYILKPNETGYIILEARGKREDKIILDHIKNLIDNGTSFVGPEYFKKIKGVYFNKKWSHSDNEQSSYVGLEIADLCSYPIHKFVKYSTKDQAFATVESKIHGYPGYLGYGLKIFP